MGRKGPKPKTYNHFQVTLDKFLGSKNLWRKPIAKDGSCLFRAVSEQVLLTQTYYHQVRLQCADYISRHRDDFKEFLTVKVDEYLHRLRDGLLWGGEVELVVFSKMYRRSIVVFNQQENQVQEQIFYSPEDEAAGRRPEDLVDPIFLAYSDGNHYDSVYMKRHKSNMAFCQSVVYSLLYERVFEESLSQSSKQRLKTLYDSEVQKLATDDKCDKHLTFLSKTYPIGVLEGMGQNCFSNIPLHVYQRERESIEQQDRSVAAAIQFQVGDKCQVPVPGEPSVYYNGEVSSPIKSNGCHMVYIFDVGEQWEIPCKDITVPTPSPSTTSAPPARRSGGPPQAWSKVHQRIQPALSRARQGSDDVPPPPAPSLPLPLPEHFLPIPTTASHHTQLPLTTTPSTTATELNHTVPKTHQSLPKPSNVTRPPPSSKSHTTKVAVGVPISAMLPRVTVAKGGGVEGGVASQRVVKKPGDVPPTEHQGRVKEDRPRTSGQPQGKIPALSAGSSGSSLLGSAPPGFPVTKDTKIVQKIAEGNKQVSLPGCVPVPDPGSSNIRAPIDVKFPPQAPLMPVAPITVPVASGFSAEPPKMPLASFPAMLVKTPAGPRGSLSTSDESASSSDESSNGPIPTQSTANTAPIPLAFFGHPMGRYMLPVLPEGRPSAHLPTNTQNAQVASVLEGPRMHAPLPHSQPPRPLVQPSTAGSPQTLPSVRPPLVGMSPLQQHNLPLARNEAGRESPYLDPQIRETRSSQPEEAWPMVGEEELHSREKLQDTPSSSSSGPLPTRLMFPFGIPPTTPDQAMTMMRQAHLASHRPPHLSAIPSNATPAGVPVSMQQVFPFLFAHQPFPTPQPHLPHVEIETESKEVQTSPALSPPTMKDQEVDVRPITTSRGVQCARVIKKDVKTQTSLKGIDVPLLLAEDIRPPSLDEDSMDMDRQIEVITQYAKQCLKVYGRSDRAGALPLQALVGGLVDCIHSTMELKEKKLREEVRVELREAVWEEVKEEVREEVREMVKQEVREEMEEAAVTSHKPLNMDEQNFLQLFTNAQQGLPESFQGGRMVPLEEHGRQLPLHLNVGVPTNQEKLPHSARNDSEERIPMNQPFVKMDGREDDASLQPHQEASIPPYPQMAPSPMMVPPGARPMVVTMPGMPPMGWYPYMPLPMFMTPQMNVLPHVIPPMAPDQGPDEQSTVQSESLPSNEGVEPTEEVMLHTEDVTVEEVPPVGPNPEGEEDGVKNSVTGELPAAFPSADLQTDSDVGEGDSSTVGSTKGASILPQTLELGTPQPDQFAQSLDDISPSAEPASGPLLPGNDLYESAQGTKGSPQAPQPGLPCRRRDINDIDRALEDGEQGQGKQGKEEKEDVPPPTQQKQYPKGRSRQGGSNRNKSRDGSYHKSQSKGYSRQGQRYTSVQTSDQSSVPPPSLRQASSSEPPPSSPTQLKSVIPIQAQLQGSSGPGTAGVKNGDEKGAASVKLGTEGVKGNPPAGRDGATGTKSTFSGGKGGGGGGRGGRGGRGKGRDNAAGSKTTTEGSEQALTKNEDRVKVDSASGDTSEGKSGRQNFNRGYQKSGFRQKDGRRVGGGTGGYRSHRQQQQNNSQTNSIDTQDSDTTQQQRPKGNGGGGKSVKYEGKKSKKVTVAAIPDTDGSQQQEPTRSGRGSPLVTDCILAKPLPSFKNLYSASPKNEGIDFSSPVQEDSWPCLATTASQRDYTPPCQYSPGSPTLTGVCKQSSTPHFSFPSHPIYAQCTFDSTLSHHDVWSWTNADDGDTLKFFPALQNTANIKPPT